MLTVVILFCVVCATYWLWRRNKVTSTEPPCYPGAWPILGHLPLFLKANFDLWNILKEVAGNSYDMGGVVVAKIGPRNVYIISDPDDCSTVATTCLEKDSFYDFARGYLGDGLATARCSIWRTHRKLLNPAFSQILLDKFMGVFNSQGRKLVKDLENEVGKGPFNHWTYTQPNALETICLTSLGEVQTDSKLKREYSDATELIFQIFTERFIKFWWHSNYTFACSNLKKQQDACLKTLHTMSNTVLQNRKSEFYGDKPTERSIPETKFKPFIDLLLELSLEKRMLNDQEIRNHVDTLLFAGQDTTAAVLMYTMLVLGSYPKVQEKLFAEIKEILGDDRDVEKTDLSKLVYLEAVLKETMRLYPIAPFVIRKTDEDVKLKNCIIPADQTCLIFIFAVHKHPMWGPDVNEFKPERWLEPGKLPDNPNAFAAFSLGKRNCIGKVYAMMSMKTTLVHVLRRYRITSDISKMRLKFDVLLKPESGGLISIEKRT